jgi:hypothetical protein
MFSVGTDFLGGTIKRNFPQADVEKLLGEADDQYHYTDETVLFDLSFGGIDAGTSIVKTSLAFAAMNGVEIESCELATSFLLSSGEACFGYYYQRDLVLNRPEGKVIHCLGLVGDPENKLLLGYIEYFSIYRIVVFLSRDYQGERFSRSYGIDPVSGSTVDLEIAVRLTQEDVQRVYDYKMIPDGSIEEAILRVKHLGEIRSRELEKERVVERAFSRACEKFGVEEDDTLTDEEADRFNSIFWQEIEPFILSQIRKSKA